eukprot:31484-Pelagococcus_subviridis.AAC.11
MPGQRIRWRELRALIRRRRRSRRSLLLLRAVKSVLFLVEVRAADAGLPDPGGADEDVLELPTVHLLLVAVFESDEVKPFARVERDDFAVVVFAVERFDDFSSHERGADVLRGRRRGGVPGAEGEPRFLPRFVAAPPPAAAAAFSAVAPSPDTPRRCPFAKQYFAAKRYPFSTFRRPAATRPRLLLLLRGFRY